MDIVSNIFFVHIPNGQQNKHYLLCKADVADINMTCHLSGSDQTVQHEFYAIELMFQPKSTSAVYRLYFFYAFFGRKWKNLANADNRNQLKTLENRGRIN